MKPFEFNGSLSIKFHSYRKMLKYYALYEDVCSPVYATEGSACFDIHAYFVSNGSVVINGKSVNIGENRFLTLEPGDIALITTGLILDIPHAHSVRLHPRSGLSAMHGITLVNCEGVIDSDYVDELKVPLINLGKSSIVISHGQRISQGELVQHYQCKIESVKERPTSKTRTGGFGSTGK